MLGADQQTYLGATKNYTVSAVLFSSAVWAQQPTGKLSQTALYSRCYAHLTGRRVPFSDVRFKAGRGQSNHQRVRIRLRRAGDAWLIDGIDPL